MCPLCSSSSPKVPNLHDLRQDGLVHIIFCCWSREITTKDATCTCGLPRIVSIILEETTFMVVFLEELPFVLVRQSKWIIRIAQTMFRWVLLTTTGVWVFAVCQRHMAKGSKHTAKGFTVGRPRRRPDGDWPDGKHAFCRVPFIGHTAKASPCVFDDTRRKKEETARRQRNGRERWGGRLRHEPNQTHGKQFQKKK